MNIPFNQSTSQTDLSELQEKHVCNKCGSCCLLGGNIELTEQDVSYIKDFAPKPKGLNWNVVILPCEHHKGFYHFKRFFPCMFWDPSSKLCRIYEFRPDACRKYPYQLLKEGGTDEHGVNVCPGV